jgi:hypothetical protein
MYSRANTWIESGPRPVVYPSLYRFSRVHMARRGMGAIPQLSQDYCDSGWSLLNPVAWFGGCAARDAANVYEAVQYGSIPRPQDLPGPPAPSVPDASVQNQAAVTPPGVTAADWAAWTQSQRDAIQSAVDAGSYNPSGNLPVNAIDLSTFWNQYGTAVMIVGVGALAFVGWKVATR